MQLCYLSYQKFWRNPDGNATSAHGCAASADGSVTSSSVDIISLPFLMELPAILFASVYGMTIPGAQHVCIAGYRERFDVQKLLPGVWGHSQEGRKYLSMHGRISFPAQRNKRKDHLYHFSERIGHISVRRHYVVA